MRKTFYISSMALTAQLTSGARCGDTHHKGCVTNLDWCNAECAEQNKKYGHEVLVVCCSTDGDSVWIAVASKEFIAKINVGGSNE